MILTANTSIIVGVLAVTALLAILIWWLLGRKKGTLMNPMKRWQEQKHLLQRLEQAQGAQMDMLQRLEQAQRAQMDILRRLEQAQSLGYRRKLETPPLSTTSKTATTGAPQPAQRLTVAGLVRALKYKDRIALSQYRSTPVKVTSASRTRQQQALEASKVDVELEPTDAGASFLIFQVNGEELLVPNYQTLELFQRYQRGHRGLFVLERQLGQAAPEVLEPARVEKRGQFWRVVGQGRVLIS